MRRLALVLLPLPLLLAAAPRPAAAADDAHVAWLAKNAVRLRSIDPADREFADLAPLKKVLDGVRIVQLGEPTHGDGAAFLARTRLIEFLIDDTTVRNLASFGALLAGILILGQLVASTLRRTAHLFMLGPFDHMGGAAFGFAKGVILVEVALIATSVFPASTTVADAIDESTLAPVFLERAPVVELALPPEFDDALDQIGRASCRERV